MIWQVGLLAGLGVLGSLFATFATATAPIRMSIWPASRSVTETTEKIGRQMAHGSLEAREDWTIADGNNRPTIDTTSLTLNLRSFGASGSTQTMTCSIVSRSPNLSNCSNGDFKTGHGIRIPGAGVIPNISAPGAPALMCKAGNRASCKGTTIYGYRIAAIQGGPNGPITAAGPEQTVTEAAQSPRPAIATSQTTPFVYTTVSWHGINKASFYLIYKSVNRGAYHFYAIVNSTHIDDYGVNWSTHNFTCDDFGVPCIAPLRPTPNDVFARIKSTNGTSYSLAPLKYLPRYFEQSGLPESTYPSQPLVTQTHVTIYHDDTPAFQAIEHSLYVRSLVNAGHVKIFIPPGDYNVYAADQYGGRRAFTFLGMNSVTLHGAGSYSKLHQIGDRSTYSSFIFAECGYDSSNASGIHSSARCPRWTKATAYPLADPASARAQSVQLIRRQDISRFSDDEYVTIGVSSSNRYPGSDYQELNRVRSLSKSKGVLNLLYPLTKTYSRSLPLPYSECLTCAGAPQIWPMPYGPSFTNVTLRDFWFEGAVRFFDYNSADYVTEDHLSVHSSTFDEKNPGFVRHAITTNNTVVQEGTLSAGASLANGSAGSADIIVSKNRETTVGFSSEQMCQEESVDIRWVQNDIMISDDQSGVASLFGGSDCYGLTFTHNRIHVQRSVVGGIFSFASPVTAEASCNGIFIDKVSKDEGGVGAPIVTNSVSNYDLSSRVRVYGTTWTVGKNLRQGMKTTWGNAPAL